MQLPEGEFFPTYMAMSLHMWMLLVRLRTQGRDGRRQMQMLYEQFQEEVTSMVKQAGVKVRSLEKGLWMCTTTTTCAAQVRVIKQLQELEKMFYGSSMAYDKVLLPVTLRRGIVTTSQTTGPQRGGATAHCIFAQRVWQRRSQQAHCRHPGALCAAVRGALDDTSDGVMMVCITGSCSVWR